MSFLFQRAFNVAVRPSVRCASLFSTMPAQSIPSGEASFLSSSPTGGNFKKGQKIDVKVLRFGRMGATVQIKDSDEFALIFQDDIKNFREDRGDDIVAGEELTGYISNIRRDGKITVSLSAVGADRFFEARTMVQKMLLSAPDRSLAIGDDNTSEEIRNYFAKHDLQMSKALYRRIIGAMWKEGIIARPGATSIQVDPNFDPNLMALEGQAKLARTLFVANLPPNYEDNTFRDMIETLFSKELKGILAVKDVRPSNPRTRGFAYVEFYTPTLCRQALQRLPGMKFEGRPLRVALNERKDVRDKQAQERSEGTITPRKPAEPVPKSVVRMFLSNLRYSVDDQALKAFMDSLVAPQYSGSVLRAGVATEQEQRTKGFAFVDVASFEISNLVRMLLLCYFSCLIVFLY